MTHGEQQAGGSPPSHATRSRELSAPGFSGRARELVLTASNTNHEFTVDGQPTGASHAAPWATSWPGDMAALSDQEMCQVNVGGDNGIYCWDKSSGDVPRSITGSFPWTSISQRGLAYRPDDDTFYIGGWNQNILYQVRGFSHATPGEVVGQCSFAGMGISGLAWNPTAEVVWIATNSATDAIYQVDADGCELLGSLPHPTPGFNGGGLHMDDAGDLWMISQTNEGEGRGMLLALTKRERDLLACLAAEPGRVWTYQQLTVAAWDGAYLDPGPVHAAVKRLRRRLRETGVPVRIDAVRGVGYHLVQPGDVGHEFLNEGPGRAARSSL